MNLLDALKDIELKIAFLEKEESDILNKTNEMDVLSHSIDEMAEGANLDVLDKLNTLLCMKLDAVEALQCKLEKERDEEDEEDYVVEPVNTVVVNKLHSFGFAYPKGFYDIGRYGSRVPRVDYDADRVVKHFNSYGDDGAGLTVMIFKGQRQVPKVLTLKKALRGRSLYRASTGRGEVIGALCSGDTLTMNPLYVNAGVLHLSSQTITVKEVIEL